uniref:Transmembrane protein 19 n=1 Tax=Megaselia scalaris TaxID=36166 RepID=T1GYT4_MEGSC
QNKTFSTVCLCCASILLPSIDERNSKGKAISLNFHLRYQNRTRIERKLHPKIRTGEFLESKKMVVAMLKYPLILLFLSIPTSMLLWLGNVGFSKISNSPDHDEDGVIPPTRWLFSILCPMMLMLYALKRKSVCASGAFLGIIVAFILSIANHAFFACLVAFFFSSSRATKFRGHIKKKIEKDFKEGEGQRNWIQVFCNSGVATLLAILYLIDCGSGEKPINFKISTDLPGWD